MISRLFDWLLLLFVGVILVSSYQAAQPLDPANLTLVMMEAAVQPIAPTARGAQAVEVAVDWEWSRSPPQGDHYLVLARGSLRESRDFGLPHGAVLEILGVHGSLWWVNVPPERSGSHRFQLVASGREIVGTALPLRVYYVVLPREQTGRPGQTMVKEVRASFPLER